MQALSLNLICSVSDEVLIKRFNKLLETLVGAQWIAASSVGCVAKQYKQFIKDDKVIHSWKNLL